MPSILVNSVVFSCEGGNYEKLINALVEKNISISKIKPNNFGFVATIHANGYRQTRKIAKKYGCKIRIIKKNGWYFKIFSLRNRFGILVGASLFFVFTLFMPKLIWHIDFYDIDVKNQKRILTQMQQVGLYAGAIQNNDNIIKAQQKVLICTPEYSWISINFIRGKIIVEAEETTPKPYIIDNSPTYITAACDGIIKSIKVYEGIGLKAAGQSVAKGELLVTGASQQGFVASQGRSRADIVAYVEKEYILAQPLQYTVYQLSGKIVDDTTLIFNSFEIPLLTNAKILNAKEKVYYDSVKVFGFALPITLKTNRQIELCEKQIVLDEEQAKLYATDILNKRLYSDLKSPEILTKKIEFAFENGTIIAKMYITANCDIGILVEQ